jgi:hypothetical protein
MLTAIEVWHILRALHVYRETVGEDVDTVNKLIARYDRNFQLLAREEASK